MPINRGLGGAAAADEAERLLFVAAELDAEAQTLLARSADFENLALSEVARFEAQRDRVVAALAALHAAEVADAPDVAERARFVAAEREKERLWRNVEHLWADARHFAERASDVGARAQILAARAMRLLGEPPARRAGSAAA